MSVRFEPVIRAVNTVTPRIITRPQDSGEGSADLDVMSAASEVRCSFVEPIGLRANATRPSVEEKNGRLELLRIGFSVNVPESLEIRWVRFAVEVVDAGDSTIALTGVLPAQIRNAFDLVGPINMDDGGAITRRQCRVHSSGIPHASFLPVGSGFLARPTVACWDFFPEEGMVSPGTSNLYVALRRQGEVALHTCQSLSMRVRHVSFGELTLSEPKAIITVKYLNT